MFEYSDKLCVICRIEFEANVDAHVTVSDKGVETLKQFSSLRGDYELYNFLLQKSCDVNVHIGCRKLYTNKRRFEQQSKNAADDDGAAAAKSLRSSATFDWKHDCFLCGM